MTRDTGAIRAIVRSSAPPRKVVAAARLKGLATGEVRDGNDYYNRS
ncbi:hypothetical protein J5J10_12920 [Ciceribacter sp. L1K23]|nr:hypothetical protein [Ciceribacter sp. L1K23]MBR0556582.1 hypothetical protein [Ciceribacter sp. L1K23]